MGHRTAVEAALDRRRRELGMKWRDVCAKANISPETLRKIRLQGTRGLDPLNIDRTEDALLLQRGSIQRVENGQDPRPIDVNRHDQRDTEPPTYDPVDIPDGLDPDDPDVQEIQAMKIRPRKKFMLLVKLLQVIEENEEHTEQHQNGQPRQPRRAG